jgi:hypothetical protein
MINKHDAIYAAEMAYIEAVYVAKTVCREAIYAASMAKNKAIFEAEIAIYAAEMVAEARERRLANIKFYNRRMVARPVALRPAPHWRR